MSKKTRKPSRTGRSPCSTCSATSAMVGGLMGTLGRRKDQHSDVVQQQRIYWMPHSEATGARAPQRCKSFYLIGASSRPHGKEIQWKTCSANVRCLNCIYISLQYINVYYIALYCFQRKTFFSSSRLLEVILAIRLPPKGLYGLFVRARACMCLLGQACN